MRLSMTDEQRMLVAAVRQTLAERASPAQVRAWLDAGDVTSFTTVMAQTGWAGVGVPEASGGQGGDLPETALIAEEMGRAASPSGAWLATMLALPALADEADLGAAVAGGRAQVAWAIPAGRIPELHPTAEAGADATLSGVVPGVLGAAQADHLLVVALRDGDPAVFCVATSAPGVRVVPRPLLDRARTVADVHLDAAAGRRLTAVDPDALAADVRARAAVLVAADALGAAQRMLDLTVTYVGQREQFGVPVGSFQAVKHAAATMLVDIEPLAALIRYAAWAVAAGEPDAALHAAAAKSHATEAAVRVAESALLLHGAIGFTWEHDLQLFYKRVKLDVELFGRPAAWRERSAALLDLLPAV